MVYAFWFLIKLTALIILLAWVSAQQGSVQMAWMHGQDEYALQITLGVFLVIVLIAAILLLALHKGLLSIRFGLKSWGMRRRHKRQGDAQKMTMQSLSSIAAGDHKTASKFTARIRKLQEFDYGMTDFLDGVAARMRGDDDEAQQHFTALAREKHSSFLGMRGLMQIGLDRGQMDQAMALAERAFKINPKQRWIVKTLYKLHVQRRSWDRAEDLLKKMVKLKAMDAAHAGSDRIAILLARAEDARRAEDFDQAYGLRVRAYKMDKSNLPAALALLDSYLKLNKKKDAVKLIEATWPHHQHPKLLEGWTAVMPASRRDDTAKYMGWYERLLALKPDSDEGQLAVAEAAMHEKLYGQARAYLKTAERIRVSEKLYRLYARLEEEYNQDKDAAQRWLERGLNAPQNKAWVCMQTGLTYDRWDLFAAPHNSFNTIIWDYPENWRQKIAQDTHQRFDPVLLDGQGAEAA